MFTSERLSRYAFRALLGFILLAAGYYFVLGGEFSVFDLRELRSEHADVEAHVDSLETTADSLDAWADSLSADSAVIERVAREKHGMIRDGERVYYFVPDTTERGNSP
jgi:cell division protein FtsB